MVDVEKSGNIFRIQFIIVAEALHNGNFSVHCDLVAPGSSCGNNLFVCGIRLHTSVPLQTLCCWEPYSLGYP